MNDVCNYTSFSTWILCGAITPQKTTVVPLGVITLLILQYTNSVMSQGNRGCSLLSHQPLSPHNFDLIEQLEQLEPVRKGLHSPHGHSNPS